jgi:hypothetical protein
MTLKDEIIRELDQLPETFLEDILSIVRSLKEKQSNAVIDDTSQDNAVWQAYLDSKQERAEVYRRLADS